MIPIIERLRQMLGNRSCVAASQAWPREFRRRLILSSKGHVVVKNATKSAFASRTTSLAPLSNQQRLGISSWGHGGGKKVPRGASSKSLGGGESREGVPGAKGRGAVDEDKVKSSDAGYEIGNEGGDVSAWDGVYRVFIAPKTGQEAVTARVGGGVLDKIGALGGVFPVVAVVHRDSEGTAGLDEVLPDVRDSSKSTMKEVSDGVQMRTMYFIWAKEPHAWYIMSSTSSGGNMDDSGSEGRTGLGNHHDDQADFERGPVLSPTPFSQPA
ncbi:hypothetical protein B0H13DRAFT_2539370 [Mycena leptocephala]|nr:hypothetical protein B0H13DRAFT_2539370 [Mycena leptocephala]